MKIETYVIASIAIVVSMKGRPWILALMYVETFKTDVIGSIIMCVASH